MRKLQIYPIVGLTRVLMALALVALGWGTVDMKKTIVALAATTLMGAGLVGVSSETANAACPYTGCVRTNTNVSAPDVKQGERARICVTVSTNGNGRPKGRVGIVVTKRSGDYRFSDSESYDGRTCFTTGRLTVGRYSVNASFEGRGAFKDSSDSTSFSVTRKRHH